MRATLKSVLRKRHSSTRFLPSGGDNRFGLPAYYSQHIWVGKGNPAGNLAMWNPAVHCR